jgi:nucleoside-diphosphate-sugar epimerase
VRVVVTGASGNIGTAVVRAVRSRGHELTAVARRPPEPSAGVAWTALDLAEPACGPALADLVAGADAVVNLAWAFQPMRRAEYLRPWVDSGRARAELGWRPRHTALEVLDELVRGMVDGAGGRSPALRPRRVLDGLRRTLTAGSVARRRLT